MLEVNFMGFFKAFLHCLLSSNGTFEMFDVILIPVPLWTPRFSPLEAYRIFTSCPVLEFESDGCCAHYLGPPSGMRTHPPASGNAAMTLSYQPCLENALAEENFQDQPVPNN